MSEKPKAQVTNWLSSQNKFISKSPKFTKAKSISIISGKGGVGKTSVSLKLAKELSLEGHKVLLIDCDYNLSNTKVKLGLSIDNKFEKFLTGEIDFEECLYIDEGFHLLSTCNGSLELFDNSSSLEQFIFNIMNSVEHKYDYILLDCPAGAGKDVCELSAYTDDRIVVMTPDIASITDSYSLIKILNSKYNIYQNHLIVNCLHTNLQFNKITKSFRETVDQYLGCRLNILGGIKRENISPDKFDKMIMNGENSAIQHSFTKIIKNYTEEMTTPILDIPMSGQVNMSSTNSMMQDAHVR